MKLLTATAPPSLAGDGAVRTPLRIALVQHRWRDDPQALRHELSTAIVQAADAGAKAVFLPELTLSKYPAVTRATGRPVEAAEPLEGGPTYEFAAAAASANGIVVHASLYEHTDGDDGRGYNTAIMVAPDGGLLGRTRKLHIPVTDGYYEDTYFRPGPSDDAYPVYEPPSLDGATIGLPTCWDEWFPEVARSYGLRGANLIVYPTAIGSEPSYPDFDTQPLWEHVIVANGITNGTFMVVPNRTGDEGGLTFYGSSFVSDPYGRVLARAPRDEEAVLVADLDLGQREDWLELFPFLTTRRPDTYAALSAPVDKASPYGRSR